MKKHHTADRRSTKKIPSDLLEKYSSPKPSEIRSLVTVIFITVSIHVLAITPPIKSTLPSYTCFRQIRPSHKPSSHQAPYLSLKETVSKSQRRKHLRPGVNSDARLVIRDRRKMRNSQKRLFLGREPFFQEDKDCYILPKFNAAQLICSLIVTFQCT